MACLLLSGRFCSRGIGGLGVCACLCVGVSVYRYVCARVYVCWYMCVLVCDVTCRLYLVDALEVTGSMLVIGCRPLPSLVVNESVSKNTRFRGLISRCRRKRLVFPLPLKSRLSLFSLSPIPSPSQSTKQNKSNKKLMAPLFSLSLSPFHSTKRNKSDKSAWNNSQTDRLAGPQDRGPLLSVLGPSDAGVIPGRAGLSSPWNVAWKSLCYTRPRVAGPGGRVKERQRRREGGRGGGRVKKMERWDGAERGRGGERVEEKDERGDRKGWGERKEGRKKV